MQSLTSTELADFEKLETIVKAGQKTFVEVGLALTEIRDRQLYRKDFKSFETYCQDRWGWSRRRGNQLISAAAVVESLPPKVGTYVPNEMTARELGKLPVPQRKEVVEESIQSEKPLTPKEVRKHFPPPPVAPLKKKTPPLPEKKTSPSPTEKKKEEPVVVRDKTGWPIPEKLLPLWERAQEVQDDLSAISPIKAKYKRLQDEKDKLYAVTNCNSIFGWLENAWDNIKTALPYAVCTSCQGHTVDTCTLCKGRGFISEYQWKTVVPRETKEMRFKAKKS